MCDCILQTNEALKPYAAVLDTGLHFTTGRELAKVAIVREGGSKRSPVQLYASFCPFCGDKYDKPKTDAGAAESDGAQCLTTA